jgi:mannitol-1-phosphate 5-dehydrogenase
MRAQRLVPIAPGLDRAFLVEEFSHILISPVHLPGFPRGLSAFEEKDDLLPFEHAKLYGHNATHALIGYLAAERGYETMAQAGQDRKLMALAREAFLEESGAALHRRHAGVDDLFTPAGYERYADDLLERMTSPHLGDPVARVTRDPLRKLGWDDRLVGIIRLATGEGVSAPRYCLGAAAATRALATERGVSPREALAMAWGACPASPAEQEAVTAMILGDAAF